jgi:hypothetical protein
VIQNEQQQQQRQSNSPVLFKMKAEVTILREKKKSKKHSGLTSFMYVEKWINGLYNWIFKDWLANTHVCKFTYQMNIFFWQSLRIGVPKNLFFQNYKTS